MTTIFASNDMLELANIVDNRKKQLTNEGVRQHMDRVMVQVEKILNIERIMERLKAAAATYNIPRDLRIGIYGFNGRRRLDRDLPTKLADVIGSTAFLYRLDALFNNSCGRPVFRTSVRSMRDPNMPGWMEITLAFFRNGVPKHMLRDDPEMPPLDNGVEALPPSPIEKNPEHYDDDDDKSDHGGGCSCRDCRDHYGWNRDY